MRLVLAAARRNLHKNPNGVRWQSTGCARGASAPCGLAHDKRVYPEGVRSLAISTGRGAQAELATKGVRRVYRTPFGVHGLRHCVTQCARAEPATLRCAMQPLRGALQPGYRP